MDTFHILWWHYPMIGIGSLLLANSVVALAGLPKSAVLKLMLFSQLVVAIALMYIPVAILL